MSNIWIFDFESLETEKVPQEKERNNDWCPMWIDDAIWFLSDLNGEFNLFSYDSEIKAVIQHTRCNDFPIKPANASNGKIIFERAGKLHLFNTANGNTQTLQKGIARLNISNATSFRKLTRKQSFSMSGLTGADSLLITTLTCLPVHTRHTGIPVTEGT